MADKVGGIHAENLQQQIANEANALQNHVINPENKPLYDEFQHGCFPSLLRSGFQGSQPGKKWGDIGDKRADAVDDGPCDPDSLEPIP